MPESNEPDAAPRGVLATDLDGTLIPLRGHEENRSDLSILTRELVSHGVTLFFVTGRHIDSVARAIEELALPRPDRVICDVGTSIYRRDESGRFELVPAYANHQERIIAGMPIEALRERLAPLDGLRLQEEEHQSRFKLSFYADAGRLEELVREIQREIDRTNAAYSIVPSVDPFQGRGLIDLLPKDVSKAHALAWLLRDTGVPSEAVVFAGDSGNDLAAMTAGYRTIVVGNAERRLARRVHDAHRESGRTHRLYLARGQATSGVREGCRWFELIGAGDDAVPVPRPGGPWGATPVTCRQTHFHVWAPHRRSVEVDVTDDGGRRRSPLIRDEDGTFSGVLPAEPGSLYWYVLDGEHLCPDPASRHQPAGVHGPSRITDPRTFAWTDPDWAGVAKRDLVIYELHVGAFTEEGTFRAAAAHIPELVELGVTAVEIMPVAQSPGQRSWGYDAVDLYAVRDTYGGPDELKRFVDRCHAAGLAVLLDVVYNHVGPDGNTLGRFGPYLSRKHKTPWGDAFNYDGRESGPVRQFIVDNAIGWLDEFHLDGLRLDAVHFMHDESDPTILDEIRQQVSEFADSAGRSIHLIAEANVYDRALLYPENGRCAYDAIWCDCLMYSIYSLGRPDVQLTPREYRGAADLALALQHGYVFAGPPPERVPALGRKRPPRASGNASPMESLVIALQTHDAVGNQPQGLRIHQLTSKRFQEAAASLTLLHPGIPLIFMGEEWAADAPFPFFCDFESERLRRTVDRHRARQFSAKEWKGAVAPSAVEAFERAKWRRAGGTDARMFSWYRQLLDLRKTGLAEGWLAADRLTVHHDTDRSVFSLRFDCPGGGTVQVQVRLTPSVTPAGAEEPIWVAMEGDVLLASDPDLRSRKGEVRLGPDRAVISRS